MEESLLLIISICLTMDRTVRSTIVSLVLNLRKNTANKYCQLHGCHFPGGGLCMNAKGGGKEKGTPKDTCICVFYSYELPQA